MNQPCLWTCLCLAAALAAAGCDTEITPPENDRDGDGIEDDADCDPDDANTWPGAPDYFGDDLDTDCDGVDGKDRDGDGYPGNGSPAVADCDDADDQIHPGAAEVCDGVDNDCDGALLEDEIDGDGDGMAPCEGDCDDEHKTVYDGAEELCDGRDNDCDGTVPTDEDDDDGDGYMVCEGDCDDDDAAFHPGADEGCDGIDNDCDGQPGPQEEDDDGDGFRICDGDCNDDDADIHPGGTEICNGQDDDCDGSLSAEEADDDNDGFALCQDDCDDNDDTSYPGAQELCDGLDNDCDGALGPDEMDGDGDGFDTCGGDCDDNDDTVRPGAYEAADGLDNDCDGTVDEGPCQLAFDGVDDLLVVAAADSPVIDGPVTVEAWVQLVAPSPVWHSMVVSRWGNKMDGNAGLRLYHDTAAETYAFAVSSDGNVEQEVVGQTVVQTLDWHHVAGVYDGASLAIYIDGTLDGEVAYADGIHDNGLGFTVGDYHPGWIQGAYDFQLEGTVAQVRVSDAAVYTGNFIPALPLLPDADTALLLHLDEGIDQWTWDDSGAAVAGTLGLTDAAEADDPTWVCNPENF